MWLARHEVCIYSSKRSIRRLSLSVFYRMVNVACIKAFILFLSYVGSLIITRFKFIKDWKKALIKAHLRRKLDTLNSFTNINDFILKTLEEEQEQTKQQGVPDD